MIERELIEEIRIANDIVSLISSYLPLKRSGSGLVGLCPFHNEKTPSFHVHDDRQLFHCFGCGASGNAITFVMRIENFEFLDAVKFLAERANIPFEQRANSEEAKIISEKKTRLYEIHKKAARFYYDCLKSEDGNFCTEYIEKRQLSPAVRIKCGLGYSPKSKRLSAGSLSLYKYLKNEGYDDAILLDSGLVAKSKNSGGYYDKFFDRLMFPIFDISGKVVGFGGRTLGDGMPKYLNSPETLIFEKGRLLYGLNFARAFKKREIIIVEGYMDVISLYQEGFLNAVASLGTAFTPHQAKLLKNYADSVILLYDNDDAGVKAVYKAIPLLVKAGLTVKVAQTLGAKDPDAYIKEFGREKFIELLNAAKSHIAFKIDNERSKFSFDENIDDKVAFTKEVSKILRDVDSAIERDAYITETAKLTGISEGAIRQEAAPPNENTVYPKRTAALIPYEQRKLPKNLIKAQKWLLGLMASNRRAYDRSCSYINETEFTSETYTKLYGLISEFYREGKEIRSAELTSYFETVEQQQEVSEILSTYNMPETVTEIEKDLNDQLKMIKKYAFDKKIAELTKENDAHAIKSAQNEQKTALRAYISLVDG